MGLGRAVLCRAVFGTVRLPAFCLHQTAPWLCAPLVHPLAAPVAKGPGDAAIGGTVNVGGPLRLRVARVGADTALAQIVRLVEAAQVRCGAVRCLLRYAAAAHPVRACARGWPTAPRHAPPPLPLRCAAAALFFLLLAR